MKPYQYRQCSSKRYQSKTIGKARTAFSILGPIWKSNLYSLKTKIKIFNSKVKSVLLYGSECWRMIQSDLKKIQSFYNGCLEHCLRKICKIFWPNKILNANLLKKINCKNITERRLRWLGNVLRMEPQQLPKVALRWTPQGKRKPGRPKTTWRKTVTTELKSGGITWGEALVERNYCSLNYVSLKMSNCPP